MTKHKHLTFSDRLDIESGLRNSKTFTLIASQIGKDPSTVSKEVRKHIQFKESSVRSNKGNNCPKLCKPPYVCNGCPMKNRDCGFNKQFYYAKRAQKEYEQTLVESREGVALNKESFYALDDFLSEKIKKGQRLNHIIASNNLGVSRATVYRYVGKNYLGVKPIDFPRIVKFKKRKSRQLPPIPTKVRKNRSYQDFLNFIQENHLNSWLEMDTVIGKTGGKVLLTFNISFCNFIFARLMENKTAAEVVRQIQVLKRDLHLANMEFSKIFPVILTDNGGEFAYADEIEKDYSTQLHLFFCDPQKPSQKGKIEKNHTLVRDIIPKGESFDDLTQEDINLVMSHVNSVRRFGLGNKTAYEIFTFTFTPELASVLGIEHIPDDKVRQSPTLLKK